MSSVIITGASSGIGRSVALQLAKSGKYEYISINSGHDEKALADVAHLIEEISDKIKVITVFGDISQNITAKALVKKTVSVAGGVDALINSAAISYVGLLMDMNPDEWRQTVAVNLDSVYNTCHEVLPYMVKEKKGRIINISSVWGLVGASCEVAYSATKGAVNAFTKALAKEMALSGIAVNAIAFGAVDTRMNGHLSDEEKNELAESIAIGRMATPEEAADTVIKMLEMPDYLTGEVLKCDGGWI